jgi:ABC-type phosphate/phosphonate transport system ATPase subunit
MRRRSPCTAIEVWKYRSLLADEPTAALDQESSRTVQFLKELAVEDGSTPSSW